ncbi:sac3 ganp family protein [Cyclospora cayetanensis]|uniref:Sac3 ganp family protein n=1 Tax=Cyclospora cayetanensis TaxID=88456 RepID=A0A1D3DAK3_9EIME|nr:sac3 ganp family protein [Cyclospora cayetanensis]
MFGIPQGTNFANAAAGSSALDGRSTEALSPPAAVNSLSKGQGGVASSATLVDAANTSQGLSAAASSVFSNTPLRAPAFGAGADTRGVSGSTTATGILFGGPSSGSASGGPLFRGPSSGSASGGPLFGSFASGSASGGPLFGGPPAARPLPSGGLFGSAVGEAAVQEGTRQAALSHQNNKAASNRVGTAAASEGLLASSSSSGLFGGAAARGPFSAARSKGNSLPSEVSNGCPPATRSGGPFEGTAAREASSFEAGSSLFGVAAARRSNAVNGHSGGPPERSALGAALTSKGPPPGHSVGGSSLFLGSVSAAAGTGGLAATKATAGSSGSSGGPSSGPSAAHEGPSFALTGSSAFQNAGTPSEEASSGSANGGSVVAVHGRSRLCAAEGRAVPPPLPQPQGSHANPMLQADLEDGALILRVQVVQQLQQFLLDGSQASSPTGGGDGSPGGAFVGQLYGCCSHEEMLDKQQVSTASDFERLDATVPGDPEARIVSRMHIYIYIQDSTPSSLPPHKSLFPFPCRIAELFKAYFTLQGYIQLLNY